MLLPRQIRRTIALAMGLAPWWSFAEPLKGPSVEEGRKFWAFQPISEPAQPSVRQQDWVKSPLDSFVLAKLEAENLRPAPPADKRTLLRRVSQDLTGLPPSPEDVANFLADDSADPFSRVVDRLLASPRYGERWGRHWLDVARYADSNGMDENVAHGNAWRYRDYAIGSFNSDKPFDRFLQEQLAGDLLPETTDLSEKHERLSALGFLCIGPKLLAETDKVKLEMDLIDEQIDSMGRAFLGMTFGCARCHDHKFDPIPTADYYSMVAIFKSTRTMDDLKTVAKWHEPELARPEDSKRLEAHRAKVTALKAKVEAAAANPSEQTTLRGELAKLEADAPEIPSAMGVTEAAKILQAFPIHLRGNHLTPGQETPRGVPRVMSTTQPSFLPESSGRLELARWMTSERHPLTARVLANRLWRWHFGQGLVASTDNFGVLGERPSHPELLDWLARRLMRGGWSIKSMHRLILHSSTYQMAHGPSPAHDPANRLLSHFPMRRLEAEAIRDAALSVGGMLDLSMGGKSIPQKNRAFVFDHTSKDATTYESKRRGVYLPVIRNHLYDLFQQFDYPDPAVPTGNRQATVVAPQSLLMMNSEIMDEAAVAFAGRLRALPHERRVAEAHELAFSRPPTTEEAARARGFLANFPGDESQAWIAYAQALLAANEFIYLR